jgi:hypothetical protein
MVTDGMPQNFARFFVKTCGGSQSIDSSPTF